MKAPGKQSGQGPAFWRTARVVFRNEGVNHLRDRRSSAGALLFPALGPLILVLGVRFGIQSERDAKLPLYVFGSANAPELVATLKSRDFDVRTPDGAQDEARSEVAAGAAHVALVVPADYSTKLRDGQAARVEVVLDSSRSQTLGLARRLERALGEHHQTLGALRLMARGVSPAVAHPVRVRSIDLATPEQGAAKLLYVIPLMLMLSAFAGGMNIAIDATAGERERRSLEPLLLTPASRLGLITGKWLTATCAALLVVGVGTVLFAFVPPFLPLEQIGLRMEFGPRAALLAFLWLVPLAGFGVALEMLVAIFAKTFKEAQTYLSLFLLVPTLPSLFLVYSPLSNTWWASLVPALAQLTAVLDGLKAEPPPLWHLLVAWLTTAVYTALVLMTVEHLMRREKVVFGR